MVRHDGELSLLCSEFKWSETRKGKTLLVENNGRTVRQKGRSTCKFDNIIGDKGFSVGKHEWILEFNITSICTEKPPIFAIDLVAPGFNFYHIVIVYLVFSFIGCCYSTSSKIQY